MRTRMDYSSLGETKSTYSNTPRSTYGQVGREVSGNVTHSSVREQLESERSLQKGSSASRYSTSTASESSGTLGVAMGLLAGASVGVLAGILMAPDSGRITRRRLSDSAAWVGRGISESFGNKGKASSWIGKAEETFNRATDTVKNTLSGKDKEV